MPEPSGIEGDGSNGTSCVGRPRPAPRLSLLVVPRNDYENIAEGWRDIEHNNNNDNDDEEPEEKLLVAGMATSNQKTSSSRSGGGASTVRRTPSSSLGSSGLHSNIPVPRRVSATITSRNKSSVVESDRRSGGVESSMSSNTNGVGRGGRTSTASNGSGAGGGYLKCMPYNSPHLIPKLSRPGSGSYEKQRNGHTVATTTTSSSTRVSFVSRIAIQAPRVNGNDSASMKCRGSKNITGSLENVHPESKLPSSRMQQPGGRPGLTVRDRNVPFRRSSGSSVDVTSRFSTTCATRSMDSLTATSVSVAVDEVDVESRKVEYRKSVSIPPDLVANMTCKFNALIEKNQTSIVSSSPSTIAACKTEIVPVSSVATTISSASTAIVVVTTSSSSCLEQSLTNIRSCPSSPMHLKDQQSGLTRLQSRGHFVGQRLCSSDRGYVSATDGNESSDAESLDLREDRVKPWLFPTLKPVERMVDHGSSFHTRQDRSPPVTDGEKLSIVKQAIRNYEVALLKSSTSSPELQRKPSLPRHSGPRQSQTLPTTVSASRMPQPCTTSVNSVSSTLPNTPFRSSFRSSREEVFNFRSQSGSPPVEKSAAIENSSAVCSKNSVPVKETQSCLRDDAVSRRLPEQSKALSRISEYSRSKDQLYHAKPAIVTTQTDDSSVEGSECGHVSPLSSPNIGATSRGRLLFQRRAATKFPDSENVKSDVNSVTDSRGSSLERSLLSDMGSMDLLAEIDSHPRLLAATASHHSLLSNSSRSLASMETASTSSVAPNASFLWKKSTQSQVSQDKLETVASGNFRHLRDLPNSKLSCPDLPFCAADSYIDDDDEPVYEELANCTSALSFPPRRDVPLSLPEETDDSSGTESTSNGLSSFYITSDGFQKSRLEDKEQADSDESWIDDSDSDDCDSTRHTSVQTKTKVRTKKQSTTKSSLVRRSWSQSLRDLAIAHENEGMAQEDLESGGWEEEFIMDELSYNARTTVASENSEKESITTSPDTDSDRSPPSANAIDVTNEESRLKEKPVKESKTKKVKRNWSWSKADFRLDLSSKLGKIRLTHNAKRQQQTLTEDVEIVDLAASDISPTKKKQWSFKTKFVNKKGGRISPKKSPTKENAQFYVPSYNEDGSLAVSPCCEQSVHDIIGEVALKSAYRANSEELTSPPSGIRASRRSRRASIAGTVARPKTAPPAPPVSKCTAESAQLPLPVNLPHICVTTASSLNSLNCHSNRESFERSVDDAVIDPVLRPVISVDCTHASAAPRQISCSSLEQFDDSSEKVSEVFSCGSDAAGITSSKSSSLDREQRIHRLELGTTFHPDTSRSSKLSPFDDEPLYQFYNKAARLRAARENQVEEFDDDDDADSCYESIYQMLCNDKGDDDEDDDGLEEETHRTKTSAMDLVRSTEGGMRTLWCEVPEVKSSGILDSMSSSQRKLQEVMFEVITSEASYLKSLNVLVECFIHCPQLSDDYSMDCVLSKRERHVLFSDVIPVKETSEKLLADLEKRWQESIVISDICDILQEHATKNFDVYVKYCSNQIYQDRCLKKLKETNPQFVEVLRRLESNPMCQCLSMYSFLMLPMQRITRLPLLVDAIFNRLEFGTKQYETCKQALATLNKIVHECNEGAHRMERMEEMLIISRQLDFRECKCVALISASRWLVKKGELTRLVFGDSSSKLSFGRRCAKQLVYLFLFTDLLIVTKRKSDDCYNVVDYCPRNLVQAMEIENSEQLPGRTHDGHRNVFQLSMLQNHDNKTVEMFFSCSKESDLTRWVEAVTPRKSENPDERIYEEWDCPQVQAIHPYTAQQPDELSLEESDVVNVFRKMSDGWFQGERIRDGVQGWFPSNYTVEIVSSHIRARNLRQRYRLLALSHSYVENQRKKELGNKGK